MIGGVDRLDPREAARLVQACVGRNGDAVGHRRNRVRPGRIAVAVDHQPRIALQDAGRAQGRRQPPRDAGGPDVPGDVQVEGGFRQAQPAEPAGNSPPGMVTDEQERAVGAHPFGNHRLQIAAAQKAHDRIRPRTLALLAPAPDLAPDHLSLPQAGRFRRAPSDDAAPGKAKPTAPPCSAGPGGRRAERPAGQARRGGT